MQIFTIINAFFDLKRISSMINFPIPIIPYRLLWIKYVDRGFYFLIEIIYI